MDSWPRLTSVIWFEKIALPAATRFPHHATNLLVAMALQHERGLAGVMWPTGVILVADRQY